MFIKAINQSIAPTAEKPLQQGRLRKERENSVLCHGIEIKNSRKIRLFRAKKLRGNTLYPKLSKNGFYCVTKNIKIP